MKRLALSIILSGCGSSQQQTQQSNPYYSMTWSCGNNAKCAHDMGAWNGAGQFTSESDCLAWETAFINNYQGSSVTSCTYHQ